MGINAFVQQNFSGGQAIDNKVGSSNSFAHSQALDFRKSPSQISVLPATRRADGGVVTDLVQDEVMVRDGTIYAIGSSGNIYKVVSGTWSLFGTVSAGCYGIDYRDDQDSIYITSQTTVSLISNVSGTPVLDPDYYYHSNCIWDNSATMGFNVNPNQSGSSNTTAIKVSAGTNDKRYFQTDISPISSISVKVVAKGTGNWTLAVKDGIGTVLGSVTILNANLTNGQLNSFAFATPINVSVGPNNAQTYNFELTSTVADGTVQSLATNDLLGCDMELWAKRLMITKNGQHPIVNFQQFECIGNGHYLTVYEPLGEASPSNLAWQRHKLTFPSGYEVCGLSVFNEYLVIAAERTTSGVNTPQDGIIFYWDGLSDTYNYFTKIPEGSPMSLHEYQNSVWYVANDDWYAITSVAATPTKVRKLPGAESTSGSNTVASTVYPHSSAVRNGIHLIGWPGTTTNSAVRCGVYSWGAVDSTQPNSFGYSYMLSHGVQYRTQVNQLKIGMVKNFGDILHISWYVDGVYGVDVVDSTSKPAAYSYYESLIFDAGIATKEKLASHVMLKWLNIDSGVYFILKYSINRSAWVYSQHFSNALTYDQITNFARFDIGTSTQEARFYEIQIGVDVYCDNTVVNPPIIVSATLVYDTLNTESLI